MMHKFLIGFEDTVVLATKTGKGLAFLPYGVRRVIEMSDYVLYWSDSGRYVVIKDRDGFFTPDIVRRLDPGMLS